MKHVRKLHVALTDRPIATAVFARLKLCRHRHDRQGLAHLLIRHGRSQRLARRAQMLRSTRGSGHGTLLMSPHNFDTS